MLQKVINNIFLYFIILFKVMYVIVSTDIIFE